jgi:hypothetical protein
MITSRQDHKRQEVAESHEHKAEEVTGRHEHKRGQVTEIQGGSNMTGTNCDLFSHK